MCQALYQALGLSGEPQAGSVPGTYPAAGGGGLSYWAGLSRLETRFQIYDSEAEQNPIT